MINFYIFLTIIFFTSQYKLFPSASFSRNYIKGYVIFISFFSPGLEIILKIIIPYLSSHFSFLFPGLIRIFALFTGFLRVFGVGWIRMNTAFSKANRNKKRALCCGSAAQGFFIWSLFIVLFYPIRMTNGFVIFAISVGGNH